MTGDVVASPPSDVDANVVLPAPSSTVSSAPGVLVFEDDYESLLPRSDWYDPRGPDSRPGKLVLVHGHSYEEVSSISHVKEVLLNGAQLRLSLYDVESTRVYRKK